MGWVNIAEPDARLAVLICEALNSGMEISFKIESEMEVSLILSDKRKGRMVRQKVSIFDVDSSASINMRCDRAMKWLKAKRGDPEPDGDEKESQEAGGS